MAMRNSRIASDDPRIQAALVELQTLIQHHYPAATFQETFGEDPEGVYLIVTIDVEDTDDVIEVYIERLLELQIDEGLSLYVMPLRPIDRISV